MGEGVTLASARGEHLQDLAVLGPIEAVPPHDDREGLAPPDLVQLQHHLAAHGRIEDTRRPAPGGQLRQALPEVAAWCPTSRSPVQVDPPSREVPRIDLDWGTR